MKKEKDILIIHIKKLNKMIKSLFPEIKHGDQEHQDWLENHLKQHFKNSKNKKVEDIIKKRQKKRIKK